MGTFKIVDGIHAVGVMNPSLRIFDIIMKSDYGTSYNAYIVKGSEKTALIETVHTKFFDEYIENIKAISPDLKIDYVILNHTEPDHSGSLKKLLSEVKGATVITSQAGSIFLKNIVNSEFPVIVVKDNDEIDLGGKTLKFINAPFLHWPDSMFTYAKEDNVLFPCDFLGCHYCEPRYLDKFIMYPEKYNEEFEYYHKAIFGPFKDYVLSGLEKIKDISPEYICPSHGPILTKQNIASAKEKYYKWSQPHKNAVKTICIFYASAYGCTKSLAEKVSEGIKSVISDAKIDLFDLNFCTAAEAAESLQACDAFAVGSPTINRDAVYPVWALLSSIDAIGNKGKPCMCFGSYGWSGEAVPMLNERLKGLKLGVFGEGIKACLIPSESELEKAAQYGADFANSIE